MVFVLFSLRNPQQWFNWGNLSIISLGDSSNCSRSRLTPARASTQRDSFACRQRRSTVALASRAQFLMMGDTPCEHLAFRSPGVNWKIWIESGQRALPRYGGYASWDDGSGSARGWRGSTASWDHGSGSISGYRGGSALLGRRVRFLSRRLRPFSLLEAMMSSNR